MSGAEHLFLEAEQRAERLVGMIRISLGAILAVALTVSIPGRLPETDGILTRQIVLAGLIITGFVAAGLLSLYIANPNANPGRFRRWHSWVFATLDVALIVAGVYLSLINTGAASNHVASLPVIWLAPLVFAFGALRFQPVQQIYVTLLLGAGLVAVVTALPGGASGDPAHLSAIGFLFETPPNVMRLVMLALAGIIVAVASARAKTLLSRAVEETRQRLRLTRYLPPEMAERLSKTNVEDLRQGQRQQVAVLFVDLRGFTSLVESMTPTELGGFVTDFRRHISVAAKRHHGVIDKFIGDAAMVLFGVPEAGPADARNAIACARAIQEEIATWNATFAATGPGSVEVGIGAHWGEVFCGAVGDETRLEFTVLGDTVNVAARIEELSKSANVPFIASADLLTAANEDLDHWRALPHHDLRGRRQRIDLYSPVSW